MTDIIKQKFGLVFEPELIEEICRIGTPATAQAGHTIITIGQQVRQIPLILQGTVKVFRKDDEGRELLLYYVSSAESCAMTFTCCMETQYSEVEAIAEDEVEMAMIPVQVMDEWMTVYPTWKSFVMRTIRLRFNELLRTIDQIAFEQLDSRLLHYLKDKQKTSGSSVLNLSHQTIADELATSRVVISRLLKKLENDKLVILYRNQIKLLSALTH